ncbi:MAG TPA: RecX family transcriptional regulator [Acetobacteraceae bacterium]|nr:RecX family transcriptional regulator [Acetobacteraceae bacterium]
MQQAGRSFTRGTVGRAAPCVDPAALHEAALAYLARYAATRATLARVLERRIARWARGAAADGMAAEAVDAGVAAARAAAAALVARLAEAGAVSDAAFAAARARRLARAGKSRRAVAAHLAAKGVDAALAAQALPADELGSALLFARRRRIGPFAEASPEERRRALGMLARAGFAAETARRVMRTTREEAEAMIAAGRDP